MKYVIQLAIIFFITLIGGVISSYLPIPIPGSIIGGILLFVLLVTKIIKTKHIADTATYLIKNFSLFFIPTGVMLIRAYPDIIDEFAIFTLIVLLTTILTFLASTYTVKFVNYLQNRKKRGKNHVIN